MERLEFENYEELACDITDNLDSIDDEYGEVSVIAKYNEAKEIIKKLLCIGYDIASVELHREEFEEYWDEYIISLNFDGVWCEKFKRENGYFTDESSVFYIMDNCSSAVIPYCKTGEMYEISVVEDVTNKEDFDDEEDAASEHEYTVNGKKVDKESFDEYISKFAPNKVAKKENKSDNDVYSISVKCNLDANEALEIIKDMERRMGYMNDMFRGVDCFRRLFNW